MTGPITIGSASDIAAAEAYAEALVARRPATPPALRGGTARPVGSAAILGAGLMASQLALLLAWHARVSVVMIDLDQERADRGVELVRKRIARLVTRGKLAEGEADAIAALVTATTDWDAIRGVDLVIEAIYEDLEAKRAAFAAVEERVSRDVILATNTSSLSIALIAQELAHPERVIGFHVFNPVEAVPLLEIVPGAATGGDAVATALQLADVLGRAVVFSSDSPGFVVNRLLTRMFDEIFRAIDAGADPAEADLALEPIGLPMTPLRLLDFVGPAVQLHVSETMHAAFPGRFALPRWLGSVVAEGRPRVLDSEGAVTAEAAALLPPRAGGADGLLERVLDALADESRRLIDEGVVAAAEDIDFSLLLGANWPRANGGVTPLLDRTGASERATGRLFHLN